MDDLQHIAESLALRIGRSVAIDDPQMQLKAHTAHDEPVDSFRLESIMRRRAKPQSRLTEFAKEFGITTAEHPVHVPANEELGSYARICVPIRCQNILFGYLWLMDSAPPIPETDLMTAMDAARSAGEAMMRERLLDDVRRAQESKLLQDLLNRDAAVRAHAAGRWRADRGLPAKVKVIVISTVVSGPDLRGNEMAIDLLLQRTQRRLAPRATLATTTGGAHGTLLVADARLPGRTQLAEYAETMRRELLHELGEDTRVQIAVGPVRNGLETAFESNECARDAIRVAQAVPASDPVIFWDELGIYGLLVQLPLETLRAEVIPAGLRRLIEVDTGRSLVQTLECYLDLAGDAASSAERLSIHRTSLYYRLRRAETITEMSLRNGSDRLALHLGIKLSRLIGLLTDEPAELVPER